MLINRSSLLLKSANVTKPMDILKLYESNKCFLYCVPSDEFIKIHVPSIVDSTTSIFELHEVVRSKSVLKLVTKDLLSLNNTAVTYSGFYNSIIERLFNLLVITNAVDYNQFGMKYAPAIKQAHNKLIDSLIDNYKTPDIFNDRADLNKRVNNVEVFTEVLFDFAGSLYYEKARPLRIEKKAPVKKSKRIRRLAYDNEDDAVFESDDAFTVAELSAPKSNKARKSAKRKITDKTKWVGPVKNGNKSKNRLAAINSKIIESDVEGEGEEEDKAVEAAERVSISSHN